jgi:hypothetical protein
MPRQWLISAIVVSQICQSLSVATGDASWVLTCRHAWPWPACAGSQTRLRQATYLSCSDRHWRFAGAMPKRHRWPLRLPGHVTTRPLTLSVTAARGLEEHEDSSTSGPDTSPSTSLPEGHVARVTTTYRSNVPATLAEGAVQHSHQTGRLRDRFQTGAPHARISRKQQQQSTLRTPRLGPLGLHSKHESKPRPVSSSSSDGSMRSAAAQALPRPVHTTRSASKAAARPDESAELRDRYARLSRARERVQRWRSTHRVNIPVYCPRQASPRSEQQAQEEPACTTPRCAAHMTAAGAAHHCCHTLHAVPLVVASPTCPALHTRQCCSLRHVPGEQADKRVQQSDCTGRLDLAAESAAQPVSATDGRTAQVRPQLCAPC